MSTTKINCGDIFHYDNGVLRWKHQKRKMLSGSLAGTIANTGYVIICVDYKKFLAHRIIWEMFNGPITDGMQIDHINHIRDDNRIENLRLVSHIENHRNLSRQKNNKSGRTGVSFDRKSGLWRAYVSRMHIGFFANKEDAISAREKAETSTGYHENHGVKSERL